MQSFEILHIFNTNDSRGSQKLLHESKFNLDTQGQSNQDELEVDFLFWSSSKTGTKRIFDTSTWKWKYVTTRPEDPFSVHVDDDLDHTFSTLLSKENNDKFKPNGKLKIIIHGFTGNGRQGWIRNMKNAYFDAGKNL